MVYLSLVIPPLLLGLVILMERVEEPLRDSAVVDGLDIWLEEAMPEEVESYVSEGLSHSLDRYWQRQAERRHRLGNRRPRRRIVRLRPSRGG